MRIEFDKDWEVHAEAAVSEYVSDLAQDVHREMQVTCPKDTGALLNDLAWEVNGTEARIGAKTVPYAYYVEVGTRPHVIKPNSKKALSWAGLEHPVSEVNHPGYVGSHFMRRALYKAR